MSGTSINLLSMDRPAMEAYLKGLGEKSFRAGQLLQWIYQRNVTSYSEMTNLSKSLRQRLRETTNLALPDIVSHNFSADGTIKFLLRLRDHNCIETVYIPEPGRGTLCVSSQVGCGLNCTFCATALHGFNRNLEVDEIIAQILVVNGFLEQMEDGEKHLFQGHGNDERRPVTNVVMMGMGEPLLNFSNVVSAMNLMMDDFSFGLSRRRVTLSTAGMVPMMDKLRRECPVSLAVSLHAADNALRSRLVPLNKKYPIEELLACCRRYADGNRQRVTFEYVMLKGVNDSCDQAGQLAMVLRDVPAKVNLIPFNHFAGSRFSRPDKNTIDSFRAVLQENNIFTVTRKTRGDDIDAACGQLAGDFIDRTSRSKRMKREAAALS